jgi:uncharacterized protein
VNPALPDWEEDLRRCHEVHQFAGIRLHPGYQGYDLKEPAFAALLARAAARGLIVQLVVTMEDERTQHPVFRAPAVDLRPLGEMVAPIAGLKLVLLNAFRRLSLDEAARLAEAGQVSFDLATLEGVDGVSALVNKVGPRRILLGSNYPLFHLESPALKLRESTLPAGILQAIGEDNARRLRDPA